MIDALIRTLPRGKKEHGEPLEAPLLQRRVLAALGEDAPQRTAEAGHVRLCAARPEPVLEHRVGPPALPSREATA
jgi:hypothetical protein